MATKAKELIKLAKDFAKEKGFELSKIEKKLLTSVAEGKDADYSSKDKAENDPKKGDTWDKSRSPNVDIIIWLCTDKEAISYLTHRGISIIGAKIDGCLDLDFIDLGVPFIFHSCYFSEGIRLESARVKLLDFSGSYITSSQYAIFAQGIEVKGNVLLNNGFNAEEKISFYGANIGGNFEARQGHFDNPKDDALMAQGANIKGGVFLDNGFQAKGKVSFLNATIGGNFQARQGRFDNPKGHAILAQSTEIKGSVFLDNGFQAKGEVSFYHATIDGNFQASKGFFDNHNCYAILAQGYAILAQGSEIKGSVLLDNGFESKGEVSFYGAIIGGNFGCKNALFNNPQYHAIVAQSAEIKGSVFLSDGCQFKGKVSFMGATISGNFSCKNALFNNPQSHAIDAQSAEIKGSVFLDDGFQAKGELFFGCATIGGIFSLSALKNTQEMTLGLESAKINCLSDKEDSWPTKNRLRLEGLVYNSIANRSPVDSQSRLKWIRLQNLKKNFSSQPYEQLAKVLRMSGHEEAAKDILIAKQNDRRRYGELKGIRWLWSHILNLTIAHGYRTQKIFGYVLLFIIVGSLIFCWGESQNLMSPSKALAYNKSETNSNTNQQQTISDDYPKFNAFMYSVDTFFPIIDFHQESYWLPNANIKNDIEIPLNYNNIICYKNACIGSLLRYYFWFHIASGWVLTSLWVAGFTGLVRRLE